MQHVICTHKYIGSGMASSIMEKCRDNYSNMKLISFPVFPSREVGNLITAPFNATLTLHYIQQNCDAVFVIDNQALFHIHKDFYKDKLLNLCGLYQCYNFYCKSNDK